MSSLSLTAPAADAWVIDASVSLAWLFEDEGTEFTEAALAGLAVTPGWVPALWTLECVNVLAQAQRRGRLTAAKRQALVASAMSLPLNLDTEQVAMNRIDALVDQFGLSAYDAAYLELAMRRSMGLISLDSKLVRAARAAGVPVLSAAGS